MNLGGCGHGAPPPSTGTARTDPVSRSSISRPTVTQELGFPYPCSLAVSPWRLPGGEAPLGSNRIAPDLWGFPWGVSPPLAIPVWFAGPSPLPLYLGSPGSPTLPFVCVFPQPVNIPWIARPFTADRQGFILSRLGGITRLLRP